MFDALEFYRDHNIKYTTEGKHSRQGWMNMSCPFCIGNPGHHLGYNLKAGFYTCYRCGFHSNLEVIKSLSNISWGKAKEILREYSTYSAYHKTKKKIKHATKIKIPSNGPFGPSYLRYLQRRGFDPYDLIQKWDLMAGGPFGKQKWRIIAPILYNNSVVSYQGRDITEKTGIKYKACKETEEIIHHKNILYGLDNTKKSCVLVEGITDVWRLGYGAVASFGIKTMSSQIFLLAEQFKKVFIMFDEDRNAQKAAEKIAWDLTSLGVETEICLIKGDPGDLPQVKANLYKKQLLG